MQFLNTPEKQSICNLIFKVFNDITFLDPIDKVETLVATAAAFSCRIVEAREFGIVTDKDIEDLTNIFKKSLIECRAVNPTTN